jgi:hypothetical protein
MTPQPQPAAYWIELLEELTGGIPFEVKLSEIDEYETLHYFMCTCSILDEFYIDLLALYRVESAYLTYGQNVIDAAVESNSLEAWKASDDDYLNAYQQLKDQTNLYLRCNGVKR